MIIEYNIPSPVDARTLNIFVRALCAYDVMWLRAHPEAPAVYKSGVRYARQPIGVESFRPVPLILQAGSADCDQLAPWRAAELRVRHGIKAMPEVQKMGDGVFHVYVRYPGGKIEDVSARLGMSVPKALVERGKALLGQNATTPPSRTAVAGWPAWYGRR